MSRHTKDKNKVERLNNLNKPISFVLPQAVLDRYGEIYDGIYDAALSLNYMGLEIVPAQAGDSFKNLFKKTTDKNPQMSPYIVNAIYAAHLDCKQDMFSTDPALGSALVLREIAKEFPEESFNEDIANHMMLEIGRQKNSPYDPRANYLTPTLNIYAKAGKIDPMRLCSAFHNIHDEPSSYRGVKDKSHKLEAIAELVTNIPSIADDVLSDMDIYSEEDIKQNVSFEDASSILKIALAAKEDGIVTGLLHSAVDIMKDVQGNQTYKRMIAAREIGVMLEAVATHDIDVTGVLDNVLAVTTQSIENAKNGTPKDENQALADNLSVLEIIAKNYGSHTEKVENIAVLAGKTAEEKQSSDTANWYGVIASAAKARDAARASQGKEGVTKTVTEEYLNTGHELFNKLLVSGNLFKSDNSPKL